MSDLARIEFLQEEVRAYAVLLQRRLSDNFKARGIEHSEDLLQSFIVTQLGGTDLSDEVHVMFKTYGRFGDMGARRGWRKGQYIGRDGRTEALKAPKGHKVYSTTAWGSQNILIKNLSSKFLEHVAQGVKSNITDGQP